MALAGDRNRRSRAQHLRHRARPDARVSRLQVHRLGRAGLRLDGGEVSGDLQRDRAARERRPLGDRRRHVGRARPQHARRRIARPPDPLRQALLQAEVRRGREHRLEPRLLRLQRAAAANLQALGHRLFRHPETAVGPRVHHVSLSPLLVAGARRHPPDDLLPQQL